jgi:hypothetical protein
MRDLLKSRHPELWEWFASTEAQSDYAEAVELELLKTTYRLDREGHEELYGLVDEALGLLGMEVPVTLYQAQDREGNSAALYYTPGHGHVVFVGGVLKLLDADERRALVGHELAHFKLWTTESGDFLVADRLLQALANEPRATEGHVESARLWQLYTEVYADRGAAMMAEEGKAAVSLLVKVSTGLGEVDAAGYLQQAEDIFAKEAATTAGVTHPEIYIRARAIGLWSEDQEQVEEEVRRMIEGRPGFDGLDLLGQERLTDVTRRLIRYHLRWPWLRSGRVTGHAGHFFGHGMPEEGIDPEVARADWDGADDRMRDYGCYLLLDFAWVDPNLEENGLAAAFLTADELGWGDRFEELARQELKLLKRDTTRIRKGAVAMVEQAAAQAGKEEPA